MLRFLASKKKTFFQLFSKFAFSLHFLFRNFLFGETLSIPPNGAAGEKFSLCPFSIVFLR